MNNKFLPIGSVVELLDGRKLIIIGYEKNNENKFTYLCAGYPSYFMIDLIPISKVKEFKEKYKFYNADTFLDFNSDYKVIYTGYENDVFKNFRNELNVID